MRQRIRANLLSMILFCFVTIVVYPKPLLAKDTYIGMSKSSYSYVQHTNLLNTTSTINVSSLSIMGFSKKNKEPSFSKLNLRLASGGRNRFQLHAFLGWKSVYQIFNRNIPVRLSNLYISGSGSLNQFGIGTFHKYSVELVSSETAQVSIHLISSFLFYEAVRMKSDPDYIGYGIYVSPIIIGKWKRGYISLSSYVAPTFSYGDDSYAMNHSNHMTIGINIPDFGQD